MRSALVLNASYRAAQRRVRARATCLVLAEKAELLEDDGT